MKIEMVSVNMWRQQRQQGYPIRRVRGRDWGGGSGSTIVGDGDKKYSTFSELY